MRRDVIALERFFYNIRINLHKNLESRVSAELWKFFVLQDIMDFPFWIESTQRLMIQNIQIMDIYLGLFCAHISLFFSKERLF